MSDPQTTIIPPEGGWKERTHYIVEVAFSPENMPGHRSIFYTGFLNGHNRTPGGYNVIFNPTYDETLRFKDAHYLKAISEITGLEDR